MGKTVVVLGASIAGIPIAHHLLKHTAAKVPGLKVVLVSPNTHFFWNLATVRAILPDMIPDDKLFFPIDAAFAKYPPAQFEFVVGTAEVLDPAKKSVTVSTTSTAADGSGKGRKTIKYDTVVIATGSSFREGMPFKNLSSTDETRAALHDWQRKIQAAESVVVAGAGTTGVELAGELGQEYGLSGVKQITIVSSDELPLAPKLKRDVRETAKTGLEKLGVHFVGGVTVASVSDSKGKKVIQLTEATPSGKGNTASRTQTLTADVFIPTYGVTPNSAFAPANMVDDRGFIKQTRRLRAEGHEDIFVVGDVGNLQPPQGKTTDDQVIHVVKLLDAHLVGDDSVAEYQFEQKIAVGVTLGRKGGTGQIGNWKPWSWLMWYYKARFLGTDYSAQFAAGLRTIQAKTWA